jgi:hypothetical protein
MQATLPDDTPPTVPQSDPHDDIVALLRGAERAPLAHDPSELHIVPADSGELPLASAPPIGPMLQTPLNDNVSGSAEAAPSAQRSLKRFVVTVCVGIVFTIGWQVYGHETWQALSSLAAPPQGSTPPVAPDQRSAERPPALAEQAAAETRPATAAVPQPAPAAVSPQPDTPPAAVPSDVTRSLEAMSREIAALKQSIEQLKASQHEMNRDLARTMENEIRRRTAAQPPKQAQPQRAAPQPSPPDIRSAAPPPPPQASPVQRDVYVPSPSPLPPQSPWPGYAAAPRPPLPLP